MTGGPIVETVEPGAWLQLGPARRHAWRRVRLPIAGLPAALGGLRIVHLSDWHLRPKPWPADDLLLERLAADPPDVVAFTGDAVDDKHEPTAAIPTVRRRLGALRARRAVLGILGNHDVGLTTDVIEGCRLIDGDMARLDVGGASIEFVGVPGLSRADPAEELLRRLWPRTADVRIVLSHHPDNLRRLGPLGADLWLAGHTHGGQVCLPTGRALITHDSLPRPLHAGLHETHETRLLVSRGLGSSSHAVRAFCPSEVWEIVLVPGDLSAHNLVPQGLGNE